jgi:hypothetical protein
VMLCVVYGLFLKALQYLCQAEVRAPNMEGLGRPPAPHQRGAHAGVAYRRQSDCRYARTTRCTSVVARSVALPGQCHVGCTPG